MPDEYNRTTELEFSRVVLIILSTKPTGRATIKQLIKEIPNFIDLTPEDNKISDTRPNEYIWEQRVRNIKSHRKSQGNFIQEGYLDSINSGLMITAAGRIHLAALHTS